MVILRHYAKPRINRNKEEVETLIYHVLKYPQVKNRYVRGLLSELIWKLSECPEGKYSTRLVSKEVSISLHKGIEVQHEHIVPKKFIIDELVKNKNNNSKLKEILDSVEGCIVTLNQPKSLKDKYH